MAAASSFFSFIKSCQPEDSIGTNSKIASSSSSSSEPWPPSNSPLWRPPKEGQACIGDLDDLTLAKIFDYIYEVSIDSDLDPPRLALVTFRWYRLDRAGSRGPSASFHYESAIMNTTFIEINRAILTKLLRSGIREMDFTGCLRLRGSDVSDLLTLCPDVTDLNISNCFNVGPMAFDNLQLRRLRVLVLGNLRLNMQPFLNAVAKAAPQLRELVVAGCLSFDRATMESTRQLFTQLAVLEMSLTPAATDLAWHPPGLEVISEDLPAMLESPFVVSPQALHPKLYGGVKPRSGSNYPVQTCLTRYLQNRNLGWFNLLVHLVTRHRASLTVLEPNPLSSLLSEDAEVLQFFVDHGVYVPAVWPRLPRYITFPATHTR